MPARMPIAAVIQIEAAVVRPRTVRPSRTITPAPRKPIPVMIPCAMRVGSIATRSISAAVNQRPGWMVASICRLEATLTSV